MAKGNIKKMSPLIGQYLLKKFQGGMTASGKYRK